MSKLSIDEALIKLAKSANEIRCEEIVDPEYWNDEWTVCPVCGCTPDNDGVWKHAEVAGQ